MAITWPLYKGKQMFATKIAIAVRPSAGSTRYALIDFTMCFLSAESAQVVPAKVLVDKLAMVYAMHPRFAQTVLASVTTGNSLRIRRYCKRWVDFVHWLPSTHNLILLENSGVSSTGCLWNKMWCHSDGRISRLYGGSSGSCVSATRLLFA
jgi:hypothetical protein